MKTSVAGNPKAAFRIIIYDLDKHGLQKFKGGKSKTITVYANGDKPTLQGLYRRINEALNKKEAAADVL